MGLFDKYKYVPGLRFESKDSAHRENIRAAQDVLASNGDRIDIIPELVAEFATHNGEYTWEDADGMHISPDIRGHFFDLDQYAEANDLTQDELDLCAKRLLHACDKFPGDIWLHSRAPAAKPWPTFDDTPHGKVAELAATLGLSAEALAYEQENKARKTVVDALQAQLVASVEVDEESLTAA